MVEPSPGPDSYRPVAPIELKNLRYPAEPSRLALAVVSVGCAFLVAIVWLMATDLPSLILAGFVLVTFLFALWVVTQFVRFRLLGDAVLVSSVSFPDVQSVVDEVREVMQYKKRVDIFVVPNLSPRVQLQSYFGIRAILIEGGAVADMTAPANRPQLLFLMGTYFGAFKAKHDRWAITGLVLDNAGIRKILAPVVAPWLRATVYTGDQIAYACARDFRTSLSAVYRELVGRELSSQLEAPGLILQAGRVSHSRVLRVVETFRSVPYATNRFLNLLRFAQQVDPESALEFRSELSDDVKNVLDKGLARSDRNGRRTFGVILVMVGAIILSASLVYLGVQEISSKSELSVEGPTTDTSEISESFGADAAPPEVDAAQSLIAAVPTAVGSCAELDAPAPDLTDGLVAAIECSDPTGGVDRFELYAYESSASIDSVVATVIQSLDAGSCTDGGWSAWTDSAGVERGVLACFFANDFPVETFAVWTYDADAVLVVASDNGMFLDEMYVWWQEASSQLELR
ncbi:hypothetical protein QNO00_17080 [Arthrobacter sp. zg-Y1219]|uniref:hypothetical protein n=1 Tax=Arthrobacter sp. zg-Y1219 TaxID=3049067 RepID=UPI0024C37812|nr:hypothetical protein [Arthrobacter sp. zg-Y1219]MDK1361966.1 hypothetical protein [Arthrobacter sp. zg-Y1219]